MSKQSSAAKTFRAGDQVIVDQGRGTEAYGTFVGYVQGSPLTVIKLNEEYCGYLHTDQHPLGYITNLVVHPDNLTRI